MMSETELCDFLTLKCVCFILYLPTEWSQCLDNDPIHEVVLLIRGSEVDPKDLFS